MTAEVVASYDAIADVYAARFLDDLDRDTNARDWLAAFAGMVARGNGVVADLGCGPGHVADHLAELGVTAVGYDHSPGQISEARNAFPDLEFRVGDVTELDDADSSLAGIVSRYSLIHLPASRLGGVFREWMRVLEPGAPILVSFFGSRSADAHGTPFDHQVVTAHEFFPAAVARQLRDTGFTDVEVGVCPPPEGGRPFDRGTVLARTPRTVSSPRLP